MFSLRIFSTEYPFERFDRPSFRYMYDSDRMSVFGGRDFYSYNGQFLYTVKDSSKLMSFGLCYDYIDGIEITSLIDSSENPSFANYPTLFETKSAYAVSSYFAYGAGFSKVNLAGMILVNYTNLISGYSLSGMTDTYISFDSYFLYEVTLSEIIPMFIYSNDLTLRKYPVITCSASRNIYQNNDSKIDLKFAVNSSTRGSKYDQFVFGNYGFSRSAALDIDYKKISVYLELFNVMTKFAFKYNVSDNINLWILFEGNTLLSSTKFGLTIKK